MTRATPKQIDLLMLRAEHGIDTKTAQAAIERPCGARNPCRNPLVNKGWLLAFGLDRKPYVYGGDADDYSGCSVETSDAWYNIKIDDSRISWEKVCSKYPPDGYCGCSDYGIY